MIDSFDILYITLMFLVPGFIIDFCLKRFIPQREAADNNHNILYYLCWSSVNYGIWAWLIYLIYASEYFMNHPVRIAVASGFIIFLSPIIVSIIVLIGYKKGFLQFISRILKLNIKHPTPTAWDYKFNSIDEKKWVIVVLDDGSSVGGIFSHKSFASSIEGERDVYLEEVYLIPSNDINWQAKPRSNGMLIKGNSIKLIEFIDDVIEEDRIDA